MKDFFELHGKYQFDITDVTAFLYVICTVMGIMNYNLTPIFFIGSAISTAFCWKARRINLIVLNGSLFILNAVSFFRMF